MYEQDSSPVNKFLSRMRGKVIRELTPYVDIFSLYYSLPPLSRKMDRLSRFASVGRETRVLEQIVAPSPKYIQVGNHVLLNELKVKGKTYVFVDHRVQDMDGLRCDQHCIKTSANEYRGANVEGNLVTLSVDLEAAISLSHVPNESWGHYRPLWSSKEGARRLMELFRRYELPVTWAVCGHLFLEECRGDHGFDEKDWFGDWFLHDPASNWRKDSSWYMPDLVRTLRDDPLFEIGYHTFGHFRYAFCSEPTVIRDMQMAESLRKSWGIELQSFVFPFNEPGYFDLLLQNGGFRYIRGNIGRQYPSTGIIDFGPFYFFNTTQMFSPETMNSCLNQVSELGSEPFNYYTHCHQWLREDSLCQLEMWLEKLARLRDDGTITVIKMGDIGKYRCR
jgi:peptidoglycan/xylan/chitin deacetylase (PgdA/CDA1 family)